jgi:hypothetical protein
MTAHVDSPFWTVATPPWADFESFFGGGTDYGSGWWNMPAVGEVFGDLFPWVLHAELGWMYAGWSSGGAYWLAHPDPGIGWIYSSERLFPWLFSHQAERWLYLLEGTREPALLYDPLGTGSYIELWQ